MSTWCVIKILAHDGLSRRDALWQDLMDIGAYVYRLIETRESLILVTDSSQAEKILKDDVRQSLREKDLEVQIPQEYAALKTVMVRWLRDIFLNYQKR